MSMDHNAAGCAEPGNTTEAKQPDDGRVPRHDSAVSQARPSSDSNQPGEGGGEELESPRRMHFPKTEHNGGFFGSGN
jgi:hypothetical protein